MLEHGAAFRVVAHDAGERRVTIAKRPHRLEGRGLVAGRRVRRQFEQRVGDAAERRDDDHSRPLLGVTMATTRRGPRTVATDDPPNFITTMTARLRPATRGCEQFGVQDRGAGRAADRVVAEGDQLVAEHRAAPHAPDAHRHAVLTMGVEPGLRAVALGEMQDGRPSAPRAARGRPEGP